MFVKKKEKLNFMWMSLIFVMVHFFFELYKISNNFWKHFNFSSILLYTNGSPVGNSLSYLVWSQIKLLLKGGCSGFSFSDFANIIILLDHFKNVFILLNIKQFFIFSRSNFDWLNWK